MSIAFGNHATHFHVIGKLVSAPFPDDMRFHIVVVKREKSLTVFRSKKLRLQELEFVPQYYQFLLKRLHQIW